MKYIDIGGRAGDLVRQKENKEIGKVQYFEPGYFSKYAIVIFENQGIKKVLLDDLVLVKAIVPRGTKN